MVNIVYLVSNLPIAGPTNQALNLLTGFNKKEVNAHLVTLFEESYDSWYEKFIAKGVYVHQLHCTRFSLLRAAKKLDAFIIEHNVDIVHSSGLSADTVNSLLKSKVAKITTIRQYFDVIGEKKNWLGSYIGKKITLWNYSHLTKLVACSNSLADNIRNVTNNDCVCVENGVDIDFYVPVSCAKKRELRKQFGLDEDLLTIVSVGVLYHRKQTYELAKSFVAAFRDDEAQLLIVGSGEEYYQLKTIADKHKNIILVGKVSNTLYYFQCADVFASASLAEGLPNTVMEAMACGLPVVLSDIGPHQEILDYDETAGSQFPTGDYGKLTQKLREIVNWNIKEKGGLARNLVVNNLSKYCTANNYLSLYKRII